jgi:hypothetical protein
MTVSASNFDAGEIKMINWNAEFDKLSEATMRYTMTSVRVERLPWTIVEPNRKRSVNWQRAARAKITGRVANFRAHQRRFMREREDYAAAQWRRTLLRAKG